MNATESPNYFPNIILNKIGTFITEVTDRISYHLTCKVLYTNRPVIEHGEHILCSFEQLELGDSKQQGKNLFLKKKDFYLDNPIDTPSDLDSEALKLVLPRVSFLKLEIHSENLDLLQMVRECTNVKTLALCFCTHEPFILEKGSIPNSVTHLTLDAVEGTTLEMEDGTIPDSVEDLIIGYQTFEVATIPQSVTRIQITNWEPDERPVIKGQLPPKIKMVQFTNVTDSMLPPDFFQISKSIEKMVFDVSDIDMSSLVPTGVNSLVFGVEFEPTAMESNSIPSSVTEISTQSSFKLLQKGLVPNSVTRLTTYETITPGKTTLPPALEYLDAENCISFKAGLFPSTLKSLIIRSRVETIEADSLPSSLTKLNIKGKIHVPLVSGMIPENLKELKLSQLTGDLPTLPSSLTKLSMKSNHQLPSGWIPPLVTELKLAKNYNHPLEKGVLPESLKILHAGNSTPLDTAHLPSSLERIIFKGFDFNEDKHQSIINLLTNTESRFEIIFPSNRLKLITLGKTSPYLYLIDRTSGFDGFIHKSKLSALLKSKIIVTFDENFFSKYLIY
eukprot:gene9290-11386_t